MRPPDLLVSWKGQVFACEYNTICYDSQTELGRTAMSNGLYISDGPLLHAVRRFIKSYEAGLKMSFDIETPLSTKDDNMNVYLYNSKPRFEHPYCGGCHYIESYYWVTGDRRWYDLYYCTNTQRLGHTTYLARYGNGRSEYLSLSDVVLKGPDIYREDHPLRVAKERSAGRLGFTSDLTTKPSVEGAGKEHTMQQATRDWLSYTDNLLAREDDAAKEIKLIMGVQRGPDYVRLRGGEVSPEQKDRLAVKTVTTAILRARFFPKAAAAANKGAAFVRDTVSKFGVDEKKAAAVADLLGIKSSNWTVNPTGTFASLAVLDEQLGSKSHFTIKVKQAAALLGLYIPPR